MLDDLITALKDAETGNRILDDEISRLDPKYMMMRIHHHIPGTLINDAEIGLFYYYQTPAYTTSIDAALELADRLVEETGHHALDILHEALNSSEGIFILGWKSNQPTSPQLARYICIVILSAIKDRQVDSVQR